MIPPNRPEPFDPRDADPLTVEPDRPRIAFIGPAAPLLHAKADLLARDDSRDGTHQVVRLSDVHEIIDEALAPDRRSCLSVIGFLVLFWAAVLLAVAGWGR